MKCIFCLEEKKASEEHVFPDAIGGRLVLSDVCRECNSVLGRDVDYKLTDNLLVQTARYIYKIPNRQGDIIGPFPDLRTDETNEPVRLILDKKTGDIEKLYIIPQKPFIEKKGDKEIIKLKLDVQDRGKAPEIIKKFCKRNGISEPSPEQFDKMLQEAEIQSSHLTLTGKFCIDVNGIKRAILKIAYELSYYWLKRDFLYDTMAALMRCVVMTGGEADLKGWFEFGINKISRILPYEKGTHFAFLYPCGDNNLGIYIRIFDCMEAGILITENSERYNINEYNAPYICIDTINKKKKEGRFIDYVRG